MLPKLLVSHIVTEDSPFHHYVHSISSKVPPDQVLWVHRSDPACGPDDGISNGFRPPSKQHRSELYRQMLDIMLHSTTIISRLYFSSLLPILYTFSRTGLWLVPSTSQLIIGWCGWSIKGKINNKKTLWTVLKYVYHFVFSLSL